MASTITSVRNGKGLENSTQRDRCDNLLSLPVEILNAIFAKLPLRALSNLTQCSKRLHLLVEEEGLKVFYYGNRYDISAWPSASVRTQSWNSKLRYAMDVEDRWRQVHDDKILHMSTVAGPWNGGYMPTVRMSDSGRVIAWTKGRYLQAMQLSENRYYHYDRFAEGKVGIADIMDVALVTENAGQVNIYAGSTDGVIHQWRVDFDYIRPPTLLPIEPRTRRRRGRIQTEIKPTQLSPPYSLLRGHSSSVKALAVISPSILVSTAFDGTVRLWNVKAEMREISPSQTYEIESLGRDRPWSLTYMKHHELIALGLTELQRPVQRPPLRLLKLTPSGLISYADLPGHQSSIYDLTFISPDVLVSASFDGSARLYDLRLHSKGSIALLEDPDDYAIYSAACDKGGRWLATGTAWHATTRLYDLRMLGGFVNSKCNRKIKPLRTMFLVPKSKTPVYSLQIDHARLYGAVADRIGMVSTDGHAGPQNLTYGG